MLILFVEEMTTDQWSDSILLAGAGPTGQDNRTESLTGSNGKLSRAEIEHTSSVLLQRSLQLEPFKTNLFICQNREASLVTGFYHQIVDLKTYLGTGRAKNPSQQRLHKSTASAETGVVEACLVNKKVAPNLECDMLFMYAVWRAWRGWLQTQEITFLVAKYKRI